MKTTDYSRLVLDSLKEHGIIDDGLYAKCVNGESKSYSHKPHLAELPYDHNTNDIDKLKERLSAVTEFIRFLEPEVEATKIDLKNKEKELKKTEKEFNKLKKDFSKDLVDSYNNWKDYKKHFENGESEFIGIDYENGFSGWSESYYNSVKEKVKNFDKRIDDILKIDFDNITNEDYKNMSKLNNEITQFMKSTYDNDSLAMEMNVYFQYADIFGQPSDNNRALTLLEKGVTVKEKLDTINDEINELTKTYEEDSRILEDYKNESDRTMAHIDRVTE